MPGVAMPRRGVESAVLIVFQAIARRR